MARRRSRLPAALQRHLIEHFVAGTPARTATELVGVHRNTATLYYRKLREVIAQKVEDLSPVTDEVELDESYETGKDAEVRVRLETLPDVPAPKIDGLKLERF